MRKRYISPGLCKNELLAELSAEARLLFACLPMMADREGRLEDRPKKIRAEIFPYDNFDVDKLLHDLFLAGFIDRYSESGCKIIQVVNFRKHQSPHKNEEKSVLPVKNPEITGVTQEITGVTQEISGSNFNFNLNSNFNLKEKEKIKKEKEPSPSASESEMRDDQRVKPQKKPKINSFRIYEAYPRHTGKDKALKKIEASVTILAREQNLDLAEAEEKMLEIVQDYARSPEVQERLASGEDRFIPYPSTWFNQNRWKDDRSCWGYGRKVVPIHGKSNQQVHYCCELDKTHLPPEAYTSPEFERELDRLCGIEAVN